MHAASIASAVDLPPEATRAATLRLGTDNWDVWAHAGTVYLCATGTEALEIKVAFAPDRGPVFTSMGRYADLARDIEWAADLLDATAIFVPFIPYSP